MAVTGVEAYDSGWRWRNWLAQTQLMLSVMLLCLVIHNVVLSRLLHPILLLQLIVVLVVLLLCWSFCCLHHVCCSWNASQTDLLFSWWLHAHWNQMQHHTVLLLRLPATKATRKLSNSGVIFWSCKLIEICCTELPMQSPVKAALSRNGKTCWFG